MTRLNRLLALGALGLSACAIAAAARPANARLSLPLYDRAVTMARPVLPARMADGDCPWVNRCEFGTEWRTCEPIPLYRDAIDGSPVLRRLKAMDIFVAEGAEIELAAPGRVEITEATDNDQTGGDILDPGAVLEVYGPLHHDRVLYFNPATNKAFSPPANTDPWWEKAKNARMTAAPRMNWWVKAKLPDGTRGWLKLAGKGTILDFPQGRYDEIMEAWDIHMTRDDETPDCAEMLDYRKRQTKAK